MPAPRFHPMLLPGVRVLWRDADTLQVGADPASAVVVSGLPPGGADLVDLLDGRRTEAEIVDAARRWDLSASDVAEILGVLGRSDLLIDGDPTADLPVGMSGSGHPRLAPELGGARLTGGDAGARRPGSVLARRARARVVVRGGGRIAVPLAAILGAAGIGHVHVDVDGTVTPGEVAVGGHRADDVRRPRATAAGEAIRAVAPETDTRPPRGGAPPDFVVVARSSRPPVVEALTPEALRIPHLALGVRGDLAVVGPLVVPGRTACLHCVYLHRCERDAGWPAVVAQLATEPVEDHCSAAVAAVAAGVAALQVLAYLDGGGPEALSAALEIGGPSGLVRRRTWAPHPRCGCLRTELADVG